jgi:hypothetical protein
LQEKAFGPAKISVLSQIGQGSDRADTVFTRNDAVELLSSLLRCQMVQVRYNGEALWDRIEKAVDSVKDRLRRVCEALDRAQISYAVIGGNAVQYWVAQVDRSVVRNTQDVDILLNRSDLPRATQMLEAAGFIFRHAAHITMFLDGPNAGARDAVHVIFAGEKVRKADAYAAPEINDATLIESDRTIPLKSLVTMKLTSFRRKDQVHLLDMISIGLIDATWCSQFPEELSQRLQQLLDDPDG